MLVLGVPRVGLAVWGQVPAVHLVRAGVVGPRWARLVGPLWRVEWEPAALGAR